MEPRKFTYEDRQLEVRAIPDNNAWSVRVFENGKPATGVVYTVAHETAIDASMRSLPHNLVEHLMELAQADIENGTVRLL